MKSPSAENVCFIIWVLMLVIAAAAHAQTTRPSFVIGVWFQPPEMFEAWKARGINTLIGEEVGNPPRMTPDSYCAKAKAAGLFVVSKAGTRANNVIGFIHAADEPNAKGIAPDTLKPGFDQFRSIDASKPVWLSLAGDAVTNGQPWKPADYARAAQLSDAFIVNAYSMNRNSGRYSTTWTATATRKLAPMVGGKPIMAMVECDWQRLATNPAGVGRAPTADEVEGTVMSSLLAGASSVGYFATIPGGQLGWDLTKRPNSYDDTQPDVDAWMRRFHPLLLGWADGKAAPAPAGDSMAEVLRRLETIQNTLDLPRTLLPATRPAR